MIDVASPAAGYGRLSPRVTSLMGSTMGPADWCDAFWVHLPHDTPADPLYWSTLLFGAGDPRRRPSGLMRVRDFLARQVGLKNAATGNGSAYPVLALDTREVVVGMDDRHLDFRVALSVRPFGSEVLVVTTAVRRHNRLGRAYFAVVTLPHQLLVPRWTRRAVRRAGAGSS